MVNSSDWFPRFRQGEEQAFRQVFEQFYRPVCYFAANILRGDTYAEDVVSDAFEKAWKAREKFDTPQHLQNFLYLVTRNACINWLRPIPIEYKTDEEWIRLAPRDPQIDDPRDVERLKALMLEGIYQKLKVLPQGAVIRMFYLEGKTIKEIAQELNTTENNVSLIKSRGLKKLKSLLSNNEWLFFVYVFLRW